MSAVNERVSDEQIATQIERLTHIVNGYPDLTVAGERLTISALRELQQYRAAAEPVLYCMEGDALDEENVSTSRAVVDAWVEEWNGEGRCPGELQYRTVPLYRHAAPQVTSVPDECPSQISDQIIDMCDGFIVGDSLAQSIWNACRAAMLESSTSQAPVKKIAAPAVQAEQEHKK